MDAEQAAGEMQVKCQLSRHRMGNANWWGMLTYQGERLCCPHSLTTGSLVLDRDDPSSDKGLD